MLRNNVSGMSAGSELSRTIPRLRRGQQAALRLSMPWMTMVQLFLFVTAATDWAYAAGHQVGGLDAMCPRTGSLNTGTAARACGWWRRSGPRDRRRDQRRGEPCALGQLGDDEPDGEYDGSLGDARDGGDADGGGETCGGSRPEDFAGREVLPQPVALAALRGGGDGFGDGGSGDGGDGGDLRWGDAAIQRLHGGPLYMRFIDDAAAEQDCRSIWGSRLWILPYGESLPSPFQGPAAQSFGKGAGPGWFGRLRSPSGTPPLGHELCPAARSLGRGAGYLVSAPTRSRRTVNMEEKTFLVIEAAVGYDISGELGALLPGKPISRGMVFFLKRLAFSVVSEAGQSAGGDEGVRPMGGAIDFWDAISACVKAPRWDEVLLCGGAFGAYDATSACDGFCKVILIFGWPRWGRGM